MVRFVMINIFSELSNFERDILISKLLPGLPVLRMKMGVSQDEIANLIGVSRQTYSSLETGKRKMAWNIFLSLVLIFDYNEQTHNHIHGMGILPNNSNNKNDRDQGISSFVSMENDDIRNHLDEQAIHAIETVIMVEYARCNNISGEAVIKAFDGKQLTRITNNDVKAQSALERIKSGSNLKK